MKHITTKDLRKTDVAKKGNTRQPCFACGKHQAITHLHHIFPLKDCAFMLNATMLKEVTTSTVWLCPNCHAYIHYIIDHEEEVDTVKRQNTHAVCKKFVEILEKYERLKTQAIVTFAQKVFFPEVCGNL